MHRQAEAGRDRDQVDLVVAMTTAPTGRLEIVCRAFQVIALQLELGSLQPVVEIVFEEIIHRVVDVPDDIVTELELDHQSMVKQPDHRAPVGMVTVGDITGIAGVEAQQRLHRAP